MAKPNDVDDMMRWWNADNHDPDEDDGPPIPNPMCPACKGEGGWIDLDRNYQKVFVECPNCYPQPPDPEVA